MYKHRSISKYFQAVIKQFPVITLTGPRQSGKTTLCKKLFPHYRYVNLEDPDSREFASYDTRGFLDKYSKETIIDEFLNVPELTSYMQSHIDEINHPGMYILTGSNQFQMLENVSQSLAGRTMILELLPFAYNEIFGNIIKSVEEVLFFGGYPRIFQMNIDPQNFYSSYFNTYVQKDIRRTLNVKDLSLFQSFVKLCAGRTGQVVNYNSFSNELGIDAKTARKWLSVLESGYIIKTIKPFYKNFNKRIIKSPKLYFYDVGLVSYLLGINNKQQLENHPLKGELFETYVFSELQKHLLNNNLKQEIYYFRDSNGKEIDFIIDQGLNKKIIEVKLTSTPSKVNFKNLKTLAPLFGENCEKYMISCSDNISKMYDTELINYREVSSL